MPAYVCLVDRWHDMTIGWRVATAAGIVVTSFSIFDLMGRVLYTTLMDYSGVSVGALVLATSLAQLRARGLA
jgi:hypothetical protein